VNRRAFLGGAGALIGLPMLEAMIPGLKSARAASPATPKRLVFFIFQGGTTDDPYGSARPGSFTPATTGSGYALTPILAPLADLQGDILVITNLHNSVSAPVPDPPTTDHSRAQDGILTGVFTANAGLPGTVSSISVDQVAANAFQALTPGLPSLSLEVTGSYEPMTLSWAGPTSPLYPNWKPSDAFNQIFGDVSADAALVKKRLAYKQSVMAYAKDDADRLRARLGKTDQQKLDEYLTSVVDLENRIQATSKACTTGGFSPQDGADLPGRAQQMLDLVTLAFQCDRTRVVTFGLNLCGSYVEWLGSDFGSLEWHNDIAHGANTAPGAEIEHRLDLYVKTCAWQMDQLGYLLRKLKNTPEGDGSGSLLDNTIVVCTSDMAYGNGHPMFKLPVVVAGRGGGTVNPGRHVKLAEQPIANLYVSILDAVGIPTTSFGNSDGQVALT
jgi:hypothetical protein